MVGFPLTPLIPPIRRNCVCRDPRTLVPLKGWHGLRLDVCYARPMFASWLPFPTILLAEKDVADGPAK